MGGRLLALLGVSAVAGCSYDWAVPAGAASDGGGLDAPVDATKDTALDVVAADGPHDASPGMDAPDVVEAASLVPCTSSQEATVAQDRAAALVCTGVTPDPCQMAVTDECGCTVYVATNNQAAQTYAMAVKNLEATCIPSCPGCGTPSPGVCIISDAGMGALACYQ